MSVNAIFYGDKRTGWNFDVLDDALDCLSTLKKSITEKAGGWYKRYPGILLDPTDEERQEKGW